VSLDLEHDQLKGIIHPEVRSSSYVNRSNTYAAIQSRLSEITSEAASNADNLPAGVLNICFNRGTLRKSCPAQFVNFATDAPEISQAVQGRGNVGTNALPA
jgi:hypothetical protein